MTGSRLLPRFTGCRRGAAALEFALSAPLLLLLVFCILGFGLRLTLLHGLEQIVAEAARASVGGITDAERASLVQESLATNAAVYPLVVPTRLSLVSASTEADTKTYRVTIRYDASDLPIYSLPFVPATSAVITRSAALRRGGY